MPLDNKISNIIGVRLPEWVLRQLETRSEQGSKSNRDNNNLLYIGNKSSWVRLVSSIDIKDIDILNNFKILGADLVTSLPDGAGGRRDTLGDASGLSQQFVLYGGTSIYLNNSYKLRAGLGKGGSYSPLGDDEIQKYGYRPMPGITNVSIETQGRLGSVRAATVNFKCWDKSQLDIIDALYFRLGYSMFLEWGHTYFYPSTNIKIDDKTNLTPDQLASTELLFSLDPFKQNLTKEDIFLHISRNSRRSEGNYDAMLGIVTQFNFTYNQEGGYDCTIKMISLGYLADGIKINNPTGIPSLLEENIIEYNKLIEAIRTKNNEGLPEPPKISEEDKVFSQLKLSEILNEAKYSLKNFSYASNVKENVEQANGFIKLADDLGEVFVIRKLNGIIPYEKEDLLSQLSFSINGLELYKILYELKINILNSTFWEEVGLGQIILEDYIRGLTNLVRRDFTSTGEDPYTTLEKQYGSEDNNSKYSVKIKRSLIARTENKLAVEQLIAVSYVDFYEKFGPYLNENTLAITDFDVLTLYNEGKNGAKFTFKFEIPITKEGQIKESFINPQGAKEERIKAEKTQITYTIPVEISFDDTRLIKTFSSPKQFQPVDFLSREALIAQDVEQASQLARQQANQSTTPDKSESPLLTISALEVMLRTIQLHSLGAAIWSNNKDLNVGSKVNIIELASNTAFIKSLFSTGVFSKFILELINGTIKDSGYENITDSEERLKVNAKYGFATNLMAGKESLYYDQSSFTILNTTTQIPGLNFQPVDYKDLLTTYVLPYNINQKLDIGTEINHPVYIKFGTLLMLLNHSCTLYDKKTEGVQLPLIYVDFNTDANFMLSNTQQMSTNPLDVIIPFEGSDDDYKSLFDPRVLTDDKTAIRALSGSNQTTPLFAPRSKEKNNSDVISGNLPPFRYGIQTSDYVAYRGKIMNILLNINYIADLINRYSTKDEQNKVFLKPFVEAILSDINKYLGNFNILRLSYNDAGNTLQVVDDQLIPVANQNETMVLKSSNIDAEIPLIGNKSIAKTLEIKTDISTKLSNMIAISANSPGNQSNASINGDYLGKLNGGYVDRYIPIRDENGDEKNSQLDGEIRSAMQFNAAIKSFYSTTSPAEDQIGSATNYFIQKMIKIKGNTPATTAAAMIPVSINFSTDGISGLGMGQSFTVSKDVLPYNYFRKLGNDYDRNVGFVVVGLNHTIENNQWNTAVRSNMIFLKKSEDYAAIKKESLVKGGQAIDPTTIQGQTPKQSNTPNADRLRRILGELGYTEKDPNREISNWGDIDSNLVDFAQKIFNFTKKDPRTANLSIQVTSGNDEYHQKNSKSSKHVLGKGLDFTISNPTPANLIAVEEIIKKYKNVYGGTFINEYNSPTEKSTGGHFHIQIA